MPPEGVPFAAARVDLLPVLVLLVFVAVYVWLFWKEEE